MKSLAPPYQNVVSVACKPSSVIGGHLSRPIVTDGFKRNPESIDGPSQSLFRFLLRAGFTSRTSRQAAGELLPHLSTLTGPQRGLSRYLSVALSLKSPSPGVTRHPVLRSSDFPRGQMPARSLVLLNNSIIMQTQCCVKNKMSFYSSKAFLWYQYL